MSIKLYPVVPVPKPRMTQRDKWQKRPAVMRYRAFCDDLRAHKCTLPESGSHVIFHMPMPKSWSKKKRAEMLGQPHRQKPDVDNLTKAILDAVLKDDSGVWDMRTTKIWSDIGCIEIRDMQLSDIAIEDNKERDQ